MDQDSFPFLIGERIYLRALQKSDADGNYVEWFNTAEVCKFNNHHRFPYLYRQAIDYIEFATNTRENVILAVVDSKTHRHIGNIALQHIDHIQRTAEFAILIGEREYWGRGFAYEASHLIINHGFTELNLHRIYCGTLQSNVGMQKLAEKLSFQKEGRRRQALYKNGHYQDVIEYGLLRHEWV